MSDIEITITPNVATTQIIVDQNTIQFTPNDIQLSVYTQGAPVAGGTQGQLQYNNLNTLAGAANTNVANGNVTFQNLPNLKIAGGSNGYFLQTDGTGSLTWAPGTINANTGPGVANGANTQIQFTDGTGNFQSAAGFTFNYISNSLAVPGDGIFAGNLQSGNANLGNAVVANYFIGNGFYLTGIGLSNGNSNIRVFANANIEFSSNGIANVATVTGTDFQTILANVANLKVRSPNVSIGNNAGNNQSNRAVAIGDNAGANAFNGASIAIGANAGNSQGLWSIALGENSGNTQGQSTVAIGVNAGGNQGLYSVAIGAGAGIGSDQQAIAIGGSAGGGQGNNSIAIGFDCAGNNLSGQNEYAIAIGYAAALDDQGINSIAIGANAGNPNGQANNSIVLNATGSNVTATTANSFVVKPIRGASSGNILYYDNTTGEISYAIPNIGNATFANFANFAGNITVNNQPNITSVGNLSNVTITGNTSTNNLSVTNNATITNNLTIQGTTFVEAIQEKILVTNVAAGSSYNYDLLDQVIVFNTANANANLTLNFRGNSTVTANNFISNSNSIVATYILTTGNTAYSVSNVNIDGTGQTIKWAGNTTPNTFTFTTMSYTFTILKTNANTYTVFGSATRYG